MSAAGGGVGRNPEVVRRRALHSLIIIVRNSDKHANVAALLEVDDDAGVFDRLPRRLQQQTMLRIHVRSFTRRDAEKLWIELIDLIQEAGPLNERLSRDPRFGIVVALDIPSICRDLADRVPAFEEQLPERFRIVHPAGEATSNSYDGDAIFVHKWRPRGRP